MGSRRDFAQGLASLDMGHADRAVAFLWYYRVTQQYDERSPRELASDLHEEGFPKQNVSRLAESLRKTPYTVQGSRKGTYQIDIRKLPELDNLLAPLLKQTIVHVSDTILPAEIVAGSRHYLEKIVHQINGAYQYGFYDCCAVLCRRLMESLIIETYISQSRQAEIQNAGVFLALEKLIARIRSDPKVTLSRNSPRTMDETKQLGDAAAHDRTYITQQIDLDEIKPRYRRLIQELLGTCGIRK